jgi:hypothetical protein
MFCATIVGSVEYAAGQMAGWNVPASAGIPPATAAAAPLDLSSNLLDNSDRPRRGPFARLVRNPSATAGLPPFALTDRGGVVQRFVEPVPGINLEPYVDQVVTVRHDTGRTLLASQLDLPPRPLVPLLGEPGGNPQISTRLSMLRAPKPSIVRAVQFVDDDDGTVQLLPEGGESTSESHQDTAVPDQPPTPGKTTSIGEELPGPLGRADATEAHRDFDLIGDPTFCDPEMVDAYAGEWGGTGRCPECGGYHLSAECEPPFRGQLGYGMRSRARPPARLFADVELNFLRTHLNGDAVGKLSEKYEFSPRLILGFRDTDVIDGRVRFWHYDQDTPVLNGGSAIRVQFDVLDLEGTQLFAGRRSEILVAGGLRLASIDLTDDDGDRAGADLLGITFAAEGRTWLGSFEGGRFALVYGGRLAVLGGDWGAELGSDFLSGLTQDDNVVVHELMAGIDYAVCHRDFDFHARLGFEMQNWHSDALAPDSIGVIGPGFQFGAEF